MRAFAFILALVAITTANSALANNIARVAPRPNLTGNDKALAEEICIPLPGPLGRLTAGADDEDGTLNAIIEIGSGTKVKYEIDPETGLVYLDRILSSSVVYPANYGFVPRTAQEDGGGLDVLVVSQASLQPGSYARVKVIGIMKMIDSGEQDDKIVAVAADDPMFRDVASLEELGEQRVGEIRRFFEDYKKGEEGKFVEVNGFEGAKEAQKAAKDALDLFDKLCQEV